jgi:hypothetical protein
MSLLVDALQPFLITQLSEVRGRQDNAALTDLIIDRRSPYRLSADPDKQQISLDFQSRDPILTALACDCNRFSTAAFQTMSLAKSDAKGSTSLPWDMIRLYYSSFYSGHAVLRLLGEACCFLDARHAARLSEFADAIGLDVGFSLTGGTYRCSIATDLKSLTFSKGPGKQGNTHEMFWKIFSLRLNHCAQAILTGGTPQRDAQAAFDKLESFSSLLRRGGSDGWLSSIRNEIQYRQSHGVWFPSSINKSERGVIDRNIGRWPNDPMTTPLTARGTLNDFIACCTFVIGLLRSLLARIVELSMSKKCFLNFGAQKFCSLP